jgi:GTP-binding protein HflX
MDDVDGVLHEIGGDALPRIVVFNQIDRLPGVAAHSDADDSGQIRRVWVSAHSGAGLDLLREAIASRLRAAVPMQRIHLPSAAAKLRGRLYRMGVVADEAIADDGGWDLHVHLDAGHLRHLLREAGVIVNEGELVESLASG